MTEPKVASSDATNIGLQIDRHGDEFVLNGTKWFSSGALNDRCQVLNVMGKTDPSASAHLQQSMVVVPKQTPGLAVGRTLHVLGYGDRRGHPKAVHNRVRPPVDNAGHAPGADPGLDRRVADRLRDGPRVRPEDAQLMDTVGNRGQATEISGIKVAVTRCAPRTGRTRCTR